MCQNPTLPLLLLCKNYDQAKFIFDPCSKMWLCHIQCFYFGYLCVYFLYLNICISYNFLQFSLKTQSLCLFCPCSPLQPPTCLCRPASLHPPVSLCYPAFTRGLWVRPPWSADVFWESIVFFCGHKSVDYSSNRTNNMYGLSNLFTFNKTLITTNLCTFMN